MTNRRCFIGGVLATLAASTIPTDGKSVLSIFGSDTKPVKGIPQAWVDAKGLDVLRYANFVQDLNLKNITPRMVLAPHFKTRGHVHNEIPDKAHWPNIKKTLLVADKLVKTMDAPLGEILSAYRCPKYNRAVGGKSHSWHMKNYALDLRYKGVSAHHVNMVARRLRSRGDFKGGVGRYPTFTHIDTRGENATW